MSDRVKNPHDAFIKEVFGDRVHAIELFQEHLPQEVSRLISWNTLEVQENSFVKSDFFEIESDIVFKAQLQQKPILLYLLFEHQSEPDEEMPYRLINYMVEIIRAHRRDYPETPIPPVIPFVFNQGPRPWKVSTHFSDAYQLEPDIFKILSPYLIQFQYSLMDLTQKHIPQSMKSDLEAILWLAKIGRLKKSDLFLDWFRHIIGSNGDSALIITGFKYATQIYEDLDMDVIEDIVVDTNIQEKVMTLYEKIVEKGRVEGRVEGRGEGREEGLEKGEVVGQIHLIQKFLGDSVEEPASLKALSLAELKAKFAALEKRYNQQFKK